jgi:hypothetical protein
MRLELGFMTQVINALLRCECDTVALPPFEYIPEAELWVFDLDVPPECPVEMGLDRIKDRLSKHRETLSGARKIASRIVLHISFDLKQRSASAIILFDPELLNLIVEIGISLEIQIASEA